MPSSSRTDRALQLKLALERRLRYEPIAIALAVPRLSGDDIADCERILVKCEMTTGVGAQAAAARCFYIRLMLRCDDATLIAEVSDAHATVQNSLSGQASIWLEGERVRHQRWCLLEFCRRGDVDGAVNALRQSIKNDRLRYLTPGG